MEPAQEGERKSAESVKHALRTLSGVVRARELTGDGERGRRAWFPRSLPRSREF